MREVRRSHERSAEPLCDIRESLDAGLGERDPQVVGLGQLVVVHLDERRHRVVDGRQLHQRHLAVLPANVTATLVIYLQNTNKV